MLVRRSTRRWLAIAVLAAFAALSGAARCIENDSARFDSEGYLHVTGEMINDTNVSATSVTLRAQLFDSNDTVYAETAGHLCPGSVQPMSRNAFDLKFATPNLPAPARYEVRPIAGSTIAVTLPPSKITIAGFDVKRFSIVGMAFRGDLKTTATTTYSGLSVCIGFFDSAGRLVFLYTGPIDGELSASSPLHFGKTDILDVPADVATARLWLIPPGQLQWVASQNTPIDLTEPP